MVESNNLTNEYSDYLVVMHLGVGADLLRDKTKLNKIERLKAKKRLLKNSLKKVHTVLSQTCSTESLETALLNLMGEVEDSGLVNAGLGCNLSLNGKALNESSFSSS